MQKRARGGFILTPFVRLHLPHIQGAGGGFLWCFDTFYASSTSLMCQSELRVYFYCVSAHLPPPLHVRVGQRWIGNRFLTSPLRLSSHLRAERAGGGPSFQHHSILRLVSCIFLLYSLEPNTNARYSQFILKKNRKIIATYIAKEGDSFMPCAVLAHTSQVALMYHIPR